MPVKLNDPVQRGNPKTTLDIRYSKKIWSFLPLLLLVVGLATALNQTLRSQNIFTRASGGAILSLAPEKSVVEVGEEFTVNVLLDPKDSMVKDAYVALNFPLDTFEITDGGRMHDRIHFDPSPDKVQVLTSIKLKALKAAGDVVIGFSSESWVAAEDKTNVLDKSFSTTIKIK